ncbi:hypothetical protein ACFV0C_15340 [Streptomyces sp. NPDC059568]|uniref:hypothetical protein n=1 Tax=Streptomyces sp. NPDC059568 TaxID=3346868 RepID=UPI0036BF32A3
MMPTDSQGRPMRLLPWTTASGAPCYLSAAGPGSRMSRMADDVEEELLISAEWLLDDTEPLLTAPPADAQELIRLSASLAVALRNILRIADSRGARLPQAGTEEAVAATEEPAERGKTECCGAETVCRACERRIHP